MAFVLLLGQVIKLNKIKQESEETVETYYEHKN